MRQQNIQTETPHQATTAHLTLLRARAFSAARILLAFVFLLSGISKLHSPASASAFVAAILPIGVDIARMMVITLSFTEVAAGLLLLLKKWVRTVALLSSFFFLSAFVVGLLYMGEDRPCGCFGDLLLSETDEWFILRSLALLFLSLFAYRINVRSSIIDNSSNL